MLVVVAVAACPARERPQAHGEDVAAIDARGRDVVLVTRANRRPAARSCRSAATAPGSGRHDTVSTPSMSISTPLMRMPRP
jgi:hypothetical protein